MTDENVAHPGSEPSDHDAAIDRAADWLRSGRVVAFPTETVYGLGANALDERAVSLVFQLKDRPSINPLIVHVSSVAMARGLCREWPDAAEQLAERFWPGPLTLVLRASGVVPANVNAGSGTVALRMPNHPVALALIDRFGGPIVGPSANRSGGISPTTAEHVAQAFSQDERVMILDGGACVSGIESTVLSLLESPARILRPGMVTAEDLAAALDAGAPLTTEAGGAADGEVLLSPGLLARHYAPHTPARLIGAGASADRWSGAAMRADRVAVLGSARALEMARLGLGDRLIHAEPMPEGSVEYAHRLYSALRNADAAGADILLIERPAGTEGLWRAIHDRLGRAASGDDEPGSEA